ncbi:Gfo/Idh/MocA family protein [Photobacterium satsumensis]|uniref:Gfo/Idh/MocA family protein n=1 Tax=Photobacterium satsumensis TaxID=2910239 RepID=UPI003D12299E
MSKINVAVVGVGIYGRHHMNAYKYNPDSNLVAFCELNPELRAKTEKEEGVPGYETLTELFELHDIDLVSIATPDPFHVEASLQSVRAGKHILVEKPLSTNVEECRLILDEAEKHNVLVGVDFHKRWDGMAQHIHNELKKEDTGKVVRGYVSMDDIIDVPENWLYWAKDSSPVYFLGSHCYDQIRYYMDGADVVEVYAIGTRGILDEKGVETWDSIQAFLKFDNGSQWTVETGWVLPSSFPKANDGRSFIITENKYFRADAQERGYEIFGEEKASTPNYNFINYRNGLASGYGIQPIHDFVDSIVNGTPYLATGMDGLKSTEICDAVHRSLETGEVVRLN